MPGYEQFFGTPLPNFESGFGLAMPFGTLLAPNGGKVKFVCSGGPPQECPDFITHNLDTTLSAALRKCKADRGDTVIVLPGHSESVTDATMLTYLVNGTRILGVGQGSKMPTFRWTAAGSRWAMDNNDVIIQGLRLRIEGANTVTEGITVTGADNVIAGCDIEIASGAALKVTLAIKVDTGGDRLRFIGNKVRGTATHNVTDCLKIIAALDQIEVLKNVMIASATAANGLIHLTAAATNILIADNLVLNTMTNSTGCIVVDNVAATGVIARNMVGTLNDGVATAQGVILGAGALTRQFENYSCDEPLKSGILTPAVVAT